MGIRDFFANRTYNHDIEVDKEYQKRCENKIKDLCGGLMPSDNYKKRVAKFKTTDSYANTYEKHILKYECKYGRLKFIDIEERLDELIRLDAETLVKIMADEDSSKFKTQKDIENYMGSDYESKFRGKLKELSKEDAIKHNSTKQDRIDEEKERRNRLISEKEKRDAHYNMFKQSIHLNSQARKQTQSKFTKSNNKTKLNVETPTKKESIPEKQNLISKGSADIEIFTNVKSNTALASTALFLATGIFVGEAKEEMKWVKSKLDIKNDGIIIKKPYSYHKYRDFHKFKVDFEDNFHIVYIVLNDEEMIILRSKEQYLGEVIAEKINQAGLAYDWLI